MCPRSNTVARRAGRWPASRRQARLPEAFRQYALALENPPLLIVSDMARFRIRTNWTNSVSRVHEFSLEDLAHPAAATSSSG